MDVVTLAPFRPPVLAEVVPAGPAPARVELKVEIVASQPPPAAAAQVPRVAPRQELPPSDAVELPAQRARGVAAYAARDPFQPRPGLMVDLRG
jgi:hypothetical protein